MKKILLALSVLLAGVVAANAQITFGTPVRINDGWKFRLDSIADYSGVKVRNSGWRTVNLPHDWSVESCMSDEYYSCTGYLPGGIGWYRKSVTIPESESGKKQYLYFGGVYCNSEVWVNGHKAGYRPNGYVSFIYDITPYVKFGGENVIAVKVDHSDQADSRWYTGSGIYRDVFLVSSGYVHIDNWGIFVKTASVKSGVAELDVTLKLVNETDADAALTVRHCLYRKGGSDVVASAASEVTVSAGGRAEDYCRISVPDPKLWSVDEPVTKGTSAVLALSELTGSQNSDGSIQADYSFSAVAAGTYTLRVSKNNHVTREYTITVATEAVTQDVKIHLKGDINGDGNITNIDVNKTNLYFRSKTNLTDYELLCADVTGDGKITNLDVNRMNLHFRDKSKLW